MVDVITAQVRQQAQQRQQQIRQQERQIEQRQQQLIGSVALRRTGGREELAQRRLESNRLQGLGRELAKRSKELARIARLPTRQEAVSDLRGQFQKDIIQARKVISKGVSTSGLTGRVRQLVAEFRAGQSPRFTESEIQLRQSLPADLRELSPGQIKAGVSFQIPGTLIEQQLRQSLPANLRELTPTEFELKQSLPSGLRDLPTNIILSKKDIRNIAKETQIQPLTAITPEQQKQERKRLLREKTIGAIKRKAKEIEGLFPADERGVVGVVEKTGKAFGFKEKKKPKLPKDIVTEEAGFPGFPSERGTIALTTREKTFFEKVGADPKDQSAIDLKVKVDNIQRKFSSNTLSEKEANAKLQTALDEFTKKQISKGVPEAVGFAAGLSLLRVAPVFSVAVNAFIIADLLLKRKQILKQSRKFPKETALITGTFLAAGLVSGKVVGGARARFGEIKLNPETLASYTKISGKQKTSLINAFEEFDGTIAVAKRQGKLTDTVAYDAVTKDGRRFKILEFSRLSEVDKLGGVKGTKEFIGLEIGKLDKIVLGSGRKLRANEVIIGGAVQRLQVGKGESFIRIIKFKPSNTKLGRFVQSRLGSGKIIDIVERSKIISSTGGILRKTATVTAEARILRVSRFQGKQIFNKIQDIERDIRTGKKPLLKIKQLVNLERRLNEQTPFTEAEFKQSKFATLSEGQIISLLKRIKAKTTRKTAVKRFGIEEERVFGGVAFSKPVPPLIKRAAKRARPKRKLSDILASPIVQSSRKKVGRPLGQKFIEAQKRIKTKVAAKLKATPSFGIVAALAKTEAAKVARSKFFRGTIFKGASIASVKAGQQEKQLQKLNQKLRQTIIQSQESRARILQGTQPSTKQRVEQIQRLNQKLVQKTKQIQEERQKLVRKIVTTTRPGLQRIPKIIVPGIDLSDFGARNLRKLGTPLTNKRGYNVFVRQRKRFIKTNLVPLPKRKALDHGAFIVDKSLARTFKIMKTKRIAKKPVRIIPSNYFSRTQSKYRPFKIRKGKQIKTINTFIERRRFGLDSGTEVRKIQAARFAKMLSKRIRRPRLQITR